MNYNWAVRISNFTFVLCMIIKKPQLLLYVFTSIAMTFGAAASIVKEEPIEYITFPTAAGTIGMCLLYEYIPFSSLQVPKRPPYYWPPNGLLRTSEHR